MEAYHLTYVEGIWLQIYKKGSAFPSLTYAEALDEALCFGWIDGQKKRLDADSWLQKFTPRRKRSLWSKVNIGHIERLESLGKITAQGYVEIEKAKQDGRWDAAYDSSSTAEVPALLQASLNQNPLAKKIETKERYIREIMVRLKT